MQAMAQVDRPPKMLSDEIGQRHRRSG